MWEGVLLMTDIPLISGFLRVLMEVIMVLLEPGGQTELPFFGM